MEEADDVRKVEKRFEKQISDLSATIHRIQVRLETCDDIENNTFLLLGSKYEGHAET